jgi:hypothetical protein
MLALSHHTPAHYIANALAALVATTSSRGRVFGSFHFPGAANVNKLTIAADPASKIPD